MFKKLKDTKAEYDRQLEHMKAQFELDVKSLELELKEKVVDYQKSLATERTDGMHQRAEYEHEFHSSMEEKKVELAKLDAEIEFKKDAIGANEARLEATVQGLQAVTVDLRLVIESQKETIKILAEEYPCSGDNNSTINN